VHIANLVTGKRLNVLEYGADPQDNENDDREVIENALQDAVSKFNLVQGCQFLGPYTRNGVVLQYSTHNNLVAFNVARDNRLDAIDLHGEDEFLNEIVPSLSAKNEIKVFRWTDHWLHFEIIVNNPGYLQHHSC
jgi:hypothetical protein